jgi:hypothetical protein
MMNRPIDFFSKHLVHALPKIKIFAGVGLEVVHRISHGALLPVSAGVKVV